MKTFSDPRLRALLLPSLHQGLWPGAEEKSLSSAQEVPGGQEGRVQPGPAGPAAKGRQEQAGLAGHRLSQRGLRGRAVSGGAQEPRGHVQVQGQGPLRGGMRTEVPPGRGRSSQLRQGAQKGAGWAQGLAEDDSDHCKVSRGRAFTSRSDFDLFRALRSQRAAIMQGIPSRLRRTETSKRCLKTSK